MGDVPEVARLYTIKPLAGDEIVETSVMDVNETRGGKNPFELLLTSSAADASRLVVPIPTYAKAFKEKIKVYEKKRGFIEQ